MQEAPCATEGVVACRVDVSYGLLDELRAADFGGAADALEVIAKHVQPLPVLKATIKEALRWELRPGQHAVLQSVLASFDAEHLFRGRQIPKKQNSVQGFLPVLRQFPARRDEEAGGSVVVSEDDGALDLAAVGFAGADPWPVSFWEDQTAAFAEAKGTFFRVPAPPLAARPLWMPGAASLRLMDRHKRWCWRFFELLRLVTAAAYRGVPQRVYVRNCSAANLGCLADWFRDCGAVLRQDEGGRSEGFHLELVLP